MTTRPPKVSWAPWLCYVAAALFGMYRLCEAVPSADNTYTTAQRITALMWGVGILGITAWQALRQARGGLHIETEDEFQAAVEKRRNSWVARRLNGFANSLLDRTMGPAGSSTRRNRFILLASCCVAAFGLAKVGEYYVPSPYDTGRDMNKLDSSKISYLTAGDVGTLPTRGLGEDWSFGRVKVITPAVAWKLMEETPHLGLHLDGVESISNLAVWYLARRPGSLSLNGLTSLTERQAEVLATHSEGYLSLNGVKSLSIASAKALARHKGTVYLRGLKEIDDDALFDLQRVAEISKDLAETRRQARREGFLRSKEGQEQAEREDTRK